MDYHNYSYKVISRKQNASNILIYVSKISESDPFYYFSLYRIYTKIKETFCLNEKVRVTEDALRMNFIQWITKTIEKKKEKSVNSGNLVIIFDGVDKYLNNAGKEESPDWLGYEYPPMVRVILTCCKGTRVFENLASKAEAVIDIRPLTLDHQISVFKNFCKTHDLNERTDLLEKIKTGNPAYSNPLFLKMFLAFQLFLGCSPSVELETEGFFVKSLRYLGLQVEQVEYFFQIIAMSKCGVSVNEIEKLVFLPISSISLLIKLYSPILHNSEGFYVIKHSFFSKVIEKNFSFPNTVHLEMIKVLDQQKFTIRKIDELLFHLTQIKDWMRIKDLLVQLEVFTIMFTPSFKLELFHHWSKLEQQHFDPVQEYNKSLEDFVAQFNPNPRVFILILIQFCRFFKDLAEIEAPNTCKFRHPNLRGYYELRDINLLEELETLPGIYSNNFIKASREDDYCSSEGQQSPEAVREKVSKDSISQGKSPEFYYYKRWIWIQFPWFAIDGNVNFSKSMKNFLYSSDFFTIEDDFKLFLNIVKVLSATRKASSKELNQASYIHLTDSPKLSRTASFSKASRGLCLLPDIKLSSVMVSYLEDEFKLEKPKNSQSLTSPPELKDFSYSVDLRDTRPSNILHRLASQMSEYTEKELIVQQKETKSLQKTFNRYKETLMHKQKALDSIVSQISSSSKLIKKQQEVREQVRSYEKKIEDTFGKCCKAEEEGKKLQKIMNCCVKNPTRNDEWQRELEQVIENMSKFIEEEEGLIKDYEREVLLIEEQCKTLNNLKGEKTDAQTSTLYKVADVVLNNSKIVSRINQRKINRKKIIILASSCKQKNSSFPDKFETALQQFRSTKAVVKNKLKVYQSIVKRLSVNSKFEEPNSLYDVITTFNKSFQLKEEIGSKKKHIEEATREKEALELQLQFFQSKKTESGGSSLFSSFDKITKAIYLKEQVFEDYYKAACIQENSLMEARIFIEKYWRGLKITEPLVNTNQKIRENLVIVYKRIVEIQENI